MLYFIYVIFWSGGIHLNRIVKLVDKSVYLKELYERRDTNRVAYLKFFVERKYIEGVRK